MDFFTVIFYGVFSLVYLLPAYASAYILASIPNRYVRALAIIPTYGLVSLAFIWVLALTLLPGLNGLGGLAAIFAFVIGGPLGLIFIIVLLYRWDKRKEKDIQAAIIR